VAFVPEEIELDISVDLAQGRDGAWSGTFGSRPAAVAGQPLQQIVIEGGSISFEHAVRPAGGRFQGKLSAGGDQIAGDFVQADRGRFPFSLHRAAARVEGPPPEVAPLGGLAQLRDAFRWDDGNPRLLLLLSPTCEMCRVGASLVKRYVLEANDDPKLRVLVVWLPISDEDTEATARRAAADLAEPRVKQYWTTDKSVGDAFKKPLGMTRGTAWDVYLVYGPQRRWTGEEPPAPDFYMHRNDDLPAALHLNARRLAEAVRAGGRDTLKPGAGR